MEDLLHCKEVGFYLQGHPHYGIPGIEADTGSLGQGLSLGSGMAIGLKPDGKSNRVYVLVGDGELDEGQIWEAAMSSGAKKLNNLCAMNPYDNVTPEGAVFVPGEPVVLREGTDVAVFACGVMVPMALKAAAALEGRISVKVVNVPSIKPMNRDSIVAIAKSVKGCVTAEEHSVI